MGTLHLTLSSLLILLSSYRLADIERTLRHWRDQSGRCRHRESLPSFEKSSLVTTFQKYEQVEQYESRDRIMSYLIVNIERYLSARAQLTRRHLEKQFSRFRRVCQLFFFCSNRYHGNYLVIVYFLVKLMWLVNALAQLFLLNAFLGNDYYLFGLEVLEKLFKNQRWTENKHFPKVTYW